MILHCNSHCFVWAKSIQFSNSCHFQNIQPFSWSSEFMLKNIEDLLCWVWQLSWLMEQDYKVLKSVAFFYRTFDIVRRICVVYFSFHVFRTYGSRLSWQADRILWNKKRIDFDIVFGKSSYCWSCLYIHCYPPT